MFIKTLQKLSIACVSALLALCLSTAAFGQQFKQFALPEPPREKGTSDVLELRCAPMESVRIGIVGLGMRGADAVYRLSFVEGAKIVACATLYQKKL